MVFWISSGRKEKEKLTHCFDLDSMRFIFRFVHFLVCKNKINISGLTGEWFCDLGTGMHVTYLWKTHVPVDRALSSEIETCVLALMT